MLSSLLREIKGGSGSECGCAIRKYVMELGFREPGNCTLMSRLNGAGQSFVCLCAFFAVAFLVDMCLHHLESGWTMLCDDPTDE